MNVVLSSEFEQELRRIHGIWRTELRYNATRFIQMINAQGGLDTARILLANQNDSKGLARLWEENRLDISMEATVLQEPWNNLFTEEQLNIAKSRLNALGYK